MRKDTVNGDQKNMRTVNFYCRRCGLSVDFESKEAYKEGRSEHKKANCGLVVRTYENKKGNTCRVLTRPDLYEKFEKEKQ